MSGDELPPIRTDTEYENLLNEAIGLATLDPPPEHSLGRRLLALVDVLEAWEREKFPTWFEGDTRVGETPEEINEALDALETKNPGTSESGRGSGSDG